MERLGEYKKLMHPGLNWVCCPLENVAGSLSLRVQQLDVYCETKTKDNVFVAVAVSIQYQVLKEKTYDAFYRLTDPTEQIRSYVFDVVRSTIPKMELDRAFESKEDIAHSVQEQLTKVSNHLFLGYYCTRSPNSSLGPLLLPAERMHASFHFKVMNDYGYQILESLVTDLAPDVRVKQSMNEINASKRLKMASMHKAEADKIKQVKAAEAEAESRYLSGVGVARQRKAIVDGLQHSINDFKSDVKGTTPKDVMDLLLLTQYFDLLRDVGADTIFMQHEPDAVSHLQKQVNGGFMKPKPGMFGK